MSGEIKAMMAIVYIPGSFTFKFNFTLYSHNSGSLSALSLFRLLACTVYVVRMYTTITTSDDICAPPIGLLRVTMPNCINKRMDQVKIIIEGSDYYGPFYFT